MAAHLGPYRDPVLLIQLKSVARSPLLLMSIQLRSRAGIGRRGFTISMLERQF